MTEGSGGDCGSARRNWSKVTLTSPHASQAETGRKKRVVAVGLVPDPDQDQVAGRDRRMANRRMLEQDVENMLSNFSTIGDFISSASVSEPAHLADLVDIIFENVLEAPDAAKLYASTRNPVPCTLHPEP